MSDLLKKWERQDANSKKLQDAGIEHYWCVHDDCLDDDMPQLVEKLEMINYDWYCKKHNE